MYEALTSRSHVGALTSRSHDLPGSGRSSINTKCQTFHPLTPNFSLLVARATTILMFVEICYIRFNKDV